MVTGSVEESVVQLLAELHAERQRTWEPSVLKVNVDQRRTLVETLDRERLIKTGDHVDRFVLEEVDDGELDLEALLKTGPAVLVFFRFAGCPACNIALAYYNRRLAPGLAALGAKLVAVSPQVPDRLVEIKRRHALDFLVATDRGNLLARRFGIVFEPDEASKAAARAKGGFIGDVTGTGTWELPMPTVVVIDQSRTVRFADVSPDWLVRSEAEPVLSVVRERSLAEVA